MDNRELRKVLADAAYVLGGQGGHNRLVARLLDAEESLRPENTPVLAHLDADKTAKPLTRLIGHARAGDCVGPGTVSADALEDTVTGERRSLSAEAEDMLAYAERSKACR